MQFQIDVRNNAAIAEAFRQYPQATMAAMTAAMHEATSYLEARIKNESPTAAGLLRDSWFSTVQVGQDRITGTVGTSSSYAIPVELGTKPHMPPIQPLKDWVAVKLGVEDVDSVAWAIAHKIKKYGTKGQHTVQTVMEDPDTERTYNRIIEKHLQRVLGR